MNILIYSKLSTYINKTTGGAETSLRLMAEKLASLGHDVTYLTYGERNAFTLIDEEINNVSIIYVPLLRNSRYLYIPSRLNIIVNKINNFLFKLILKKVLISKNIEIIYSMYHLDELEFLIKKIPQLSRPIIIMRMAGLQWSVRIKKDHHLKDRYEFVFNSVDSINFISKGLIFLSYKHADQHGIKLNVKNSFIGDIGVDPNKLKNKWKGKIQSEGLSVIVATRFSKYAKRQDIIVEAVKRIKLKGLIKVTLIGDGPSRNSIQEKIIQYGLSGQITVIPFLEQNELWNYMQNSDLLCHPCDFEGLSKIIIESMMMGLPVLASNVIPLCDYIKDGVNGYLADNNPDTWAEKLVHIYNNKKKLVDVSKEQISFAEKYYNADKNVLMYESEFYSLLENR